MAKKKQCRKCGADITWKEYNLCDRHCFLCAPPDKPRGREYQTTIEEDSWNSAIYRNDR